MNSAPASFTSAAVVALRTYEATKPEVEVRERHQKLRSNNSNPSVMNICTLVGQQLHAQLLSLISLSAGDISRERETLLDDVASGVETVTSIASTMLSKFIGGAIQWYSDGKEAEKHKKAASTSQLTLSLKQFSLACALELTERDEAALGTFSKQENVAELAKLSVEIIKDALKSGKFKNIQTSDYKDATKQLVSVVTGSKKFNEKLQSLKSKQPQPKQSITYAFSRAVASAVPVSNAYFVPGAGAGLSYNQLPVAATARGHSNKIYYKGSLMGTFGNGY